MHVMKKSQQEVSYLQGTLLLVLGTSVHSHFQWGLRASGNPPDPRVHDLDKLASECPIVPNLSTTSLYPAVAYASHHPVNADRRSRPPTFKGDSRKTQKNSGTIHGDVGIRTDRSRASLTSSFPDGWGFTLEEGR